MPDAVAKAPKLSGRLGSDAFGVRVGWVVETTGDGRAIVDYPGNPLGPLPARSAIAGSVSQNRDGEYDVPLLLVFENGDVSLPIVVGFVQDQWLPTPEAEEVIVANEPLSSVVVDGKRVTIDAEKEIVLKCGKGSITLRADGKIVVKGTQLVSRASRANKIKGASVDIN